MLCTKVIITPFKFFAKKIFHGQCRFYSIGLPNRLIGYDLLKTTFNVPPSKYSSLPELLYAENIWWPTYLISKPYNPWCATALALNFI